MPARRRDLGGLQPLVMYPCCWHRPKTKRSLDTATGPVRDSSIWPPSAPAPRPERMPSTRAHRSRRVPRSAVKGLGLVFPSSPPHAGCRPGTSRRWTGCLDRVLFVAPIDFQTEREGISRFEVVRIGAEILRLRTAKLRAVRAKRLVAVIAIGVAYVIRE